MKGKGDIMSDIEKGKLYVCATPIGNLKDVTIRVLETLQQVDLVAAEDTRQTVKLLNHYDIKKPLESYYQHNEENKGAKLIEIMQAGQNVALVSDAGMPGISDPGETLIKLCYENEIEVTVLPGATASVTALVLSGMKARSFCFEGFLPSNKRTQQEILERMKNDVRTQIVYVAPHDLNQNLGAILKVLGDRKICVAKELTKMHETIFTGTVSTMIDHFAWSEIKGEYVIVLEGANEEEVMKQKQYAVNCTSIEDNLQKYILSGDDNMEAMKKVAKDRGMSKREVYNQFKIK